MKRLSYCLFLVALVVGAAACGGVDEKAVDGSPTADGGPTTDAPPSDQACVLGTSRVGSCTL